VLFKGGSMRTLEEKLTIIEELKQRVHEFMEQKPKYPEYPGYIDLCDVLEEVYEYPEYVE
jgi:hypothetical protein